MLIFKVVVVLCIFSRYTDCKQLFSKKTLIIDRFIPKCPGVKNLIMVVDRNIKLVHENGILLVNANFTITRDTSSDIKAKVVINRCKSKENLDSCEMYPEMAMTNICFLIHAKMPPFNHAFNNIQPQIDCPIKKNSYRIVNATIDDTLLSMFPIEGYYIRSKNVFLENIGGTYKIIGCMQLELKVVPVKTD